MPVAISNRPEESCGQDAQNPDSEGRLSIYREGFAEMSDGAFLTARSAAIQILMGIVDRRAFWEQSQPLQMASFGLPWVISK